MDVFVLHHIHAYGSTRDRKLIGIYSSRAEAEAAIRRLSPHPGFRDLPEGFWIEGYQVDQDHWREGFLTVRVGESSDQDEVD